MPKIDECYALLKDQIINGTYGPGQRIALDQLVRSTGIGTMPWREAMRRLQAEGWVEIVPNVGGRVSSFPASEWVRAMRLVARLEGLATAVAASTMTTYDVSAARSINSEMLESLRTFDAVQFLQLSKDFHVAICSRANDAHLISILNKEWPRLELTRSGSFGLTLERATQSVAEHTDLLNLLAAGADFGILESVARNHKLGALEAATRGVDGQTS